MKLVRAFIYSNLFVAFVLSALTLSAYAVVPNIPFRWHTWISVFFGSFVLYNFHRLYKIDFIPEDQLSARHHWVLRHASALKIAMAAAVLLMMLILPHFNADTIVALVPAGIISVGYTIPIFPTENGWRRFRDIPLTKPLIISLVVTYLTLAFPVFDQWGFQAVYHPTFIGLFAERMLFLLAVTIPFDLRDLRSDETSGIATLATQLGFKTAKKVGLIALFAWLAMVLWNKLFHYYKPELTIALVVLCLLLMYAFSKTNPNRSDLFYVLCFEGAILIYAFALIFVQTMA